MQAGEWGELRAFRTDDAPDDNATRDDTTRSVADGADREEQVTELFDFGEGRASESDTTGNSSVLPLRENVLSDIDGFVGTTNPVATEAPVPVVMKDTEGNDVIFDAPQWEPPPVRMRMREVGNPPDEVTRQGLYWLSDAGWEAIELLLSAGRSRVDDRAVISGMLHVLRSGSQWRRCPAAYGPWSTISSRLERWRRRGLWQRVMAALRESVPDEVAAIKDIPLKRSRARHHNARDRTRG